MSSPESPETSRIRRRWLQLVVLVVGGLLYAAVWRLPALFSGRTGGGTLLLSRQEGSEWVNEPSGAEVPARARVRFGVRLSKPASVVLIGLTAEGHAVLYAPDSGTPLRVGEGVSVLGEATLDGVAGEELLLAELCNTPLGPSVVLKAAERAVAASVGPFQVQTLDLGCPEARFQLVKEPRP